MNTFELIEQSDVGREYSQKLKENISDDIRYEFISRISEVLNSLDKDQQEIVKHKFSNFGNLNQLLDKLCEILVAYKFLDKEPIFGDDANGDPDLFLKRTEEYIEIKRLNNSDFQNNAIEFMQKNNNRLNDKRIFCSDEESRKKSAINKKITELIDKAYKQLRNKKGIIILVYSIDIINNRHTTDIESFENTARGYAQSLNFKDIHFEIIDHDNLFGERLNIHNENFTGIKN